MIFRNKHLQLGITSYIILNTIIDIGQVSEPSSHQSRNMIGHWSCCIAFYTSGVASFTKTFYSVLIGHIKDIKLRPKAEVYCKSNMTKNSQLSMQYYAYKP